MEKTQTNEGVMTAMQARPPCPPWQVYKGYKLNLLETESGIKLKSSAAELRINFIANRSYAPWRVWWSMSHDCGRDTGYRYLTEEEMRRAFGLQDGLGQFGRALADRTSTAVDAAEQSKFVRAKDWLNISHPGTGLQGDPNISIELDTDIKIAVRTLLASQVIATQ